MITLTGKEAGLLSKEPARVLHFVSAMNRGGTETLLMNVYRNLDREKIQFDFVSHREETCDYDNEIESLGGKVYRIGSLGQKGPVIYINEIRKILKQRSYLAVHSHTDFQSGFPALSAKLSGINKRICHSHSTQCGLKSGLKGKLLLTCLQTLIRFSATDYCACSTDAGEFLFGRKSVVQGHIQLLNNGIDTAEYLNESSFDSLTLRDELKLDPETILIGHVGNFSEIKNQSFLLRLLKKSIEEGLNYTVVFVGEGPLRTEIETKAKEMGLSNRTKFLGVRQDIPRLMKAFEAFLFPSLNEGFGMVTIEAQCAGTPCVVSDSIPRSTDMGLNLIRYLNLNDNLLKWIEEINRMIEVEKPDENAIFEQFKRNGFSIHENINDWLTLYGFSHALP